MPKPIFKISIVLAVLALPVGFFGWLTSRIENSRADIVQAERCLEALGDQVLERVRPLKDTSRRLILNQTQQAAVEQCVRHLTYHNQDIGKSKFVARTGVFVEQHGPDAPDYNQRSSTDPWAVKEWSSSMTEAVGIGLVSTAGTFAVALIVLLLLRWFWLFVLDRIRELSKAVRGK